MCVLRRAERKKRMTQISTVVSFLCGPLNLLAITLAITVETNEFALFQTVISSLSSTLIVVTVNYVYFLIRKDARADSGLVDWR